MTKAMEQTLPAGPPPSLILKGADGVRLAADSWGDPSTPLVVLLHGGGQTRHAWRSTGKLLGDEGFHVVAFDARGHGDSDWAPDGDYSQEAFVKDLQCLVREVGGMSPIFVGASLGGNTSLTAIGEGYVNASALVLLDVTPKIERQGFDRIKEFMESSLSGFASLEEAAISISRYKGKQRRVANPSGLAKNLRVRSDGFYYWHWDPLFLSSREDDYQERHKRLSSCLQSLDIPTLLVRGVSSDVVSDEGVEEFFRLCPSAECVDVFRAGHMITGDDNERFIKPALEFLKRTLVI